MEFQETKGEIKVEIGTKFPTMQDAMNKINLMSEKEIEDLLERESKMSQKDGVETKVETGTEVDNRTKADNRTKTETKIKVEDEYLTRCKSGMVLIGSRALVHYLPACRTLTKENDYDFIATHESTMDWIASLGENVVFEQSNIPFDFKQYGELLSKDISQWKHWDTKLGAKCKENLDFTEQNGNVKKITGHTDKIKFEIEIAPKGGSRSSNSILKMCGDFIVAPLQILEAIKTSHMVFSKNFRKHMTDLHLMRDRLHRKGNYFEPARDEKVTEIMYLRRIEHCLMFGVPGFHINLNKTNEAFLETDSVLYTDKYILHDDLHLKTCYGKTPAYDDLRLDKTKAMMDKALFDKASNQVRLNCVREEAMTIALERYLLPSRSSNAQDAYEQALLRVCTTLTKGWFREYAINAYPFVQTLDKNLIAIRDEILKEYEQRQIQARIQETKLEDRKRSRADLLIKAPKENVEWRVEFIFPMIFEEKEELTKAQELVGYISLDSDDVYHCDDGEFNFYWKMDADYYYDDQGWCASYNRWHAYITCAPAKYLTLGEQEYFDEYAYYDEDVDYRNKTREIGPNEYLAVDGYQGSGRNHEYCVFSANMMDSASDSFGSEPEATNYDRKECTSLDDISDLDPIVTPDFLMRFMIAVSFPARWSHSGYKSWPTTDFHFMYDAWKK